MTNKMTSGLPPTHPGEVLRDIVVPAIDRPKAEIARLLKMSRQHFYDILNCEKPITPQTAYKFAKMFGGSPKTWLQMQANYDLSVLGPKMEAELAEIPVLEAA